MSAVRLLHISGPFLWLALAAFLAGYLSYAGLAGARALPSFVHAQAPRTAAPAADGWNLPKRI